MCDDSYVERMYWARKMEQLRQEMEREEAERQRKAAAAPAAPAKPTAEDPQPLPV